MESLKKIIQLLQTMIEAHTKLLALAKEKRSVLVEGDILGLQSVSNRESTCADEIQRLENERKEWVMHYLTEKGVQTSSPTLEELLKFVVSPAEKIQLTLAAKQLRMIIQEISHINESNQQLIQTSLSYVQYSIGLHVRKEPSIGYGPYASKRYRNLLDIKY
jgi:hypothetical protein